MSRELPEDKNEWTEDDWEYAAQRDLVSSEEINVPTPEEGGGQRVVSALTGQPVEVNPNGTVDFDDDYATWKVAELKAEADARDLVYPDNAKKAELIDLLREYDRNNPESNTNG